MIATQLKKEVLSLKAIDKVHLIEDLFASMDRPSPEIEKKWAKESDHRFEAYKQGDTTAKSFDQIKVERSK